jgi:hypothetical protein
MDIEKHIAYQIEAQFPSIYREDGPELVELIKTYYKFIESDVSGAFVSGFTTNEYTGDRTFFSEHFDTVAAARQRAIELEQSNVGGVTVTAASTHSVYHNRRLLDYNDIDNTLDKMLRFYKAKYMVDIEVGDNADTRFIIKHILDLYRAKGSTEGIRLFFQLFYGSKVEIYKPSADILKPSASTWKRDIYLELYPSDIRSLNLLNEQMIVGASSGTTAVVESVLLYPLNSVYIPVLRLSNVMGVFVHNDILKVGGQQTTITVRGSLTGIEFPIEYYSRGKSGNEVGDIVTVTSSTGAKASARVAEISGTLSNEADLTILDGGFGYTPRASITFSTQTLYVLDSFATNLRNGERLHQPTSGAYGTILGQTRYSDELVAVGVLTDDPNEPFRTSQDVVTINRPSPITGTVNFASLYNNSVSADLGMPFANQIEGVFSSDPIVGLLDVRLDSLDFNEGIPFTAQLQGIERSPNLSTVLEAALSSEVLPVGSVSELININPGQELETDVFVRVFDPLVTRLNIFHQRIHTAATNPFRVGSIVVQYDNLEIVAKGVVTAFGADWIQVKPLMLSKFVVERAVDSYTDFSLSMMPSSIEDVTELRIGEDANIYGYVTAADQRIEEVEILSSGVGFVGGAEVRLFNETRIQRLKDRLAILQRDPEANLEEIAAIEVEIGMHMIVPISVGVAVTKGQGTSEGRWVGYSSHLNSTKRIQDSFYYQDYSYQIGTSMVPNTYRRSMQDIVHVAGTKPFFRVKIESDLDFDPEVNSYIFGIDQELLGGNTLVIDNDDIVLTDEHGTPYAGRYIHSTVPLWATPEGQLWADQYHRPYSTEVTVPDPRDFTSIATIEGEAQVDKYGRMIVGYVPAASSTSISWIGGDGNVWNNDGGSITVTPPSAP